MSDKPISRTCVKCNFKDFNEDSEFCPQCGTYLFNHCSNDMCKCNNGFEAILPNSYRYCDVCGSKTTYFEEGLIPDFEE